MKLLLASGGVTTDLIRERLVDLLGRPVEECSALVVPTAEYGHPWCTPQSAWRFVSGRSPAPMADLGWASVGLLEPLALPHVAPERWQGWVREADALLVDGGDATFLAHALRTSGLSGWLPAQDDLVWVGLSAGTMVATPAIGRDFVAWPDAPDDRGLGWVDFSVFPHLEHPDMPENRMADAERWAAGIGREAWALDDHSALCVVDGQVELLPGKHWRHFPG